MNILLSGSSGFIGTALRNRLESAGHTVVPLTRGDGRSAAQWRPEAGQISLPAMPFDAVIHLAGENVASGLWTSAKMNRIRESRVQGTTLLAKTIAKLDPRPRVFISASAIGYYGDTGATIVDENTPCGDGFLAKVCAEWEESAAPAAAAGIRVVHPRFGLVVDPTGGLLAKMLPPFRCGLGGVLGNGEQYMSWISLHDVLAAIDHCLAHDKTTGPINFVAPNPVTNREWTQTLAQTLRRPAVLPVPRWVLRLLFRRMADEALLASARVKPLRLEQEAFPFRHRELRPTLEELLK